jgi:hypothetical protein
MSRPTAPPSLCEACAAAERPPAPPRPVPLALAAGLYAWALTAHRAARRPSVAQMVNAQGSLIAAMLGPRLVCYNCGGPHELARCHHPADYGEAGPVAPCPRCFPAAVDWYARHRQAWIETGDPDELARMLRHPLPPQHDHRRPPDGPQRLRARHWALLLAVLAVVVLVSRLGVL